MHLPQKGDYEDIVKEIRFKISEIYEISTIEKVFFWDQVAMVGGFIQMLIIVTYIVLYPVYFKLQEVKISSWLNTTSKTDKLFSFKALLLSIFSRNQKCLLRIMPCTDWDRQKKKLEQISKLNDAFTEIANMHN